MGEGGRSRRVSPEQHRQGVVLHGAGLTKPQIAARVGLSVSRVGQVLRAAGIKPRRTPGSGQPYDAARRRVLAALPAAAPLAGVPAAEALVRAAVRVEGLGAQPEALAGEGPRARALRGVLLAAGLVLTLAGEAGKQARALVRGVLGGAWRASSLVEGLNSVLRMHQGRQKRLTQGLLDLKRLHWNLHEFRAGKRKKSSPYRRLGLVLPTGSWWDLLRRPPEQLRQELSALNPAA
jgi:hypothetical protein